MKNKLIKIIGLSVCLLMVIELLYLVIDFFIDEASFSKESRYAISSSVVIGATSVTGTESNYYFEINGTSYRGSTKRPLHRDGTKYFIKFYPPNPERNEATVIVADSSDIANLPSNGYEDLPHK